MKGRNLGLPLTVLAVALWLGVAPGPGLADAETNSVKQLLELTGGRRAKTVWNQGAEGDQKVMYLDTKEGEIEELPFKAGSAPLISRDGRFVLVSTGKAPDDRKVIIYSTEAKKMKELASGPGNHLLAIWQDPKNKRVWCYVNDSGDKNESWNVPAGAIYRFPADKPAERELFWDRTSSHIYLMFSEDGTRACFEPSWANIGELKLAFTAAGKVDQDKSDYKTYGGGCFPSMAPDNSYRLFRLEGDHRSITMCDEGNANQRQVRVDGVLTKEHLAKGANTWLTRWSTDPEFLTLIAPAGADNSNARIWMGRFNKGFTEIEKWAPVSKEGMPQCWQSQAWVEPK